MQCFEFHQGRYQVGGENGYISVLEKKNYAGVKADEVTTVTNVFFKITGNEKCVLY